jgi:hypothetical protein
MRRVSPLHPKKLDTTTISTHFVSNFSYSLYSLSNPAKADS